jgi:hypothetical protein
MRLNKIKLISQEYKLELSAEDRLLDTFWCTVRRYFEKLLQEVGSRNSVDTWKYGIQRYNISTFRSYFIENSLLLHYVDQFINAV